jgi:uncharacterized membrane protein
MELFIFLAFVTLLILVILTKTSSADQFRDLTKKIDLVNRQLEDLRATARKEISPAPVAAPVPEKPKPEIVQPLPPRPAEVIPPVVHPQNVVREAAPVPKPAPVVSAPAIPAATPVRPVQPQPQRKPEPKVAKPTFFEKNPDLEKFIGENLINKIGIGILVLGIGFFVKYAISQNWINEIGRTAIGVLCGAILIGLAHKLRKTFTAFSSVLVGGGLAVLYFTIAIAFHQYHIFNQTAAFAIMVVITAFSVVLAVSYDRKELAVLAIIGGFASPFMLNTGEGNYISLFIYITILNLGMLTLSYFKKWNILTVISYVFTILLFGGWLSQVAWTKTPPYTGALVFGTIFYLIFFCMNILNNVKEKRSFNALEILMLLSNTILYYSAGMFILGHLYSGELKGAFTVFMAVFHFGFCFVLFKNKKIDKNLVYLLIGLVLTFVSLAGPVQLQGNQITLFWSAETVLLLWLAQMSGIQLLKQSALLVLVLMLVSLAMDWEQLYFHKQASFAILLNRAFVTGIVAVAALIGSILLLKKEKEVDLLPGFPVKNVGLFLRVVLIFVLYITLLFELRYQLYHHMVYYGTREIVSGCYNYAFLLALNLYVRRKQLPYISGAVFCVSIAALFFYPLFYHGLIVNSRNVYLTTGQVSDLAFGFHYVIVALALFLAFVTVKNSRAFREPDLDRILLWFLSIVVIFAASSELDHLITVANYGPELGISEIIKQNHKIGFPILWAICSFMLMLLGMRFKRRDLRIVSLTLFLVIIVKLFVFDIRGISEGGKIAAFIFLGVILLIVSFLYQKLKKLVLEDDSKTIEKDPETKPEESYE